MKNFVLITGASSGIGLALARIFALKGHHLILVSQNPERLSSAERIIRSLNPQIEVLTLSADLSQPAHAAEVFRFTQKNQAFVEILVNNAGVQIFGNFHDIELDRTGALVALNVNSVVEMTGLFLPSMLKNRRGRILNIGSTASFQPAPLNAAYCASKAFVLHFSEGISAELYGTGVTVSTLCPGATETSFAVRGNMLQTPYFNRKLQSADRVAARGYKGLMKGRRIIMTSFSDSFLRFVIRFLPRSLVLKLGMKLMKKPS